MLPGQINFTKKNLSPVSLDFFFGMLIISLEKGALIRKRLCHPRCRQKITSFVLGGDAMVLGKLPASAGCPTNMDYSRARAYCVCSRCWWGLFGHFFSCLLFLSSFSLSLGDSPI